MNEDNSANGCRSMDGNEYCAVMLYKQEEEMRSIGGCGLTPIRSCLMPVMSSKLRLTCPSCLPHTQDNLPGIPGRDRQTTFRRRLQRRNSRDAPTTEDQETP